MLNRQALVPILCKVTQVLFLKAEISDSVSTRGVNEIIASNKLFRICQVLRLDSEMILSI